MTDDPKLHVKWTTSERRQLREQAAIAICAGIVSRDAMPAPSQVASQAVRIADALLAELAKDSQP